MCIRYHSLGYCFKDSRFVKGHGELDPKKTSEMERFLGKARAARKKLQENQDNNELDKFNELSSLIIELSKTQKIYFDNRTLLGFSLPDELSDIDREILESQMPILERKIEDLQKIVNEKISEL